MSNLRGTAEIYSSADGGFEVHDFSEGGGSSGFVGWAATAGEAIEVARDHAARAHRRFDIPEWLGAKLRLAAENGRTFL